MSEVLPPRTSSGIWSRASRRGGPSAVTRSGSSSPSASSSREQLKLFAVQFFLQVREFPRAVSAMHANCPFPKERMELAESVYEEETGGSPAATSPTPELFIRFGEAVGLSRSGDGRGRPLPATRALIDWFELSTKQRSFIEAAAAINLAAEGQVPGAFGPMARRPPGELRAQPRGGGVLGHPRDGRCGAQ
jgi:hypothetical protein